jgi:hypothetical protein
VVDIVDSHDTFKNQWRKRKTFYKKENYKIIYTTSPKYNPDTSTWTLVFNPVSKDCIVKKDKTNVKKNISVKSNSSSDKSIANDSDEEVEEEPEKPKDKYLAGVCFLKMKKYKYIKSKLKLSISTLRVWKNSLTISLLLTLLL